MYSILTDAILWRSTPLKKCCQWFFTRVTRIISRHIFSECSKITWFTCKTGIQSLTFSASWNKLYQIVHVKSQKIKPFIIISRIWKQNGKEQTYKNSIGKQKCWNLINNWKVTVANAWYTESNDIVNACDIVNAW